MRPTPLLLLRGIGANQEKKGERFTPSVSSSEQENEVDESSSVQRRTHNQPASNTGRVAAATRQGALNIRSPVSKCGKLSPLLGHALDEKARGHLFRERIGMSHHRCVVLRVMAFNCTHICSERETRKAGDAKAFQTSNACTHVTEYVMRRACVRAVIIMQVTMKHKIKHQPKIGVVAVTK